VKQVQKATDDLIRAILGSDYYIRYHKCLNKIKKQKDLYQEFNKFRKRYFQLMNKSDCSYDEIEALQLKYHKLLINPDIVEFMDVNDRLCLALTEMYTKIGDELDMDIDFIDE
jgi:cell fate (sporulation/competence/biofilm development) regulator YlbF (YheA/YmcA/DUF963 family)